MVVFLQFEEQGIKLPVHNYKTTFNLLNYVTLTNRFVVVVGKCYNETLTTLQSPIPIILFQWLNCYFFLFVGKYSSCHSFVQKISYNQVFILLLNGRSVVFTLSHSEGRSWVFCQYSQSDPPWLWSVEWWSKTGGIGDPHNSLWTAKMKGKNKTICSPNTVHAQRSVNVNQNVRTFCTDGEPRRDTRVFSILVLKLGEFI